MDQSMKIEQFLLKLLQYSSLNEDIEFVTTEQLQEFLIHECIPFIDPMNEMDEDFYEFYCCQIIQKFSYFLDLQSLNRMNVRKLVHSSIMSEMLSLIRLQQFLQEKEIELTEKNNARNATPTSAGSSSFPPLISPKPSPSPETIEINLIIDKVRIPLFVNLSFVSHPFPIVLID
jgi:hypothetical protein